MGHLKSLIGRNLGKTRIGKRVLSRYRLQIGQPRWQPLLPPDWPAAVAAAAGGKRILIATSFGGYLPGTTMESMLAVALTLRGAAVQVLLCDGALPACTATVRELYASEERFLRHGPQKDFCADCFGPANAMYRSLGLPVHRYSQLLTADEQRTAADLARTIPFDAIGAYTVDGLAVGEHALAGTLRYYASGNLSNEPHAEETLRRYFEAALRSTYALRRLIETERYDCIVFNHGIYVPHGLVGEVARAADVRVVNWHPAYRKRSFIFSHNDTYHHTLMTEPTDRWDDMLWDAETEAQILDYLRSRWQGSQDWIWFVDKPQFDVGAIERQIGIDFSKPTIGMLTNVMWDAQLHYPANAFPNMLAWTLETIEYFAARPDLQLLIRVHPAEIRGSLASRQPIIAEIAGAFPTLPPNVFIVGPESDVSTYAAMAQCNAVIIYGTKTGVELTSMGIPVIVAGEAWIRNKGITRDARTREHYLELLDGLPLAAGLDAATVERARKYAYHFFFRRMIPVEYMQPTNNQSLYTIGIDAIDQLRPGQSAGLDVICDGILNGTDFIYKAEEAGVAAAQAAQ